MTENDFRFIKGDGFVGLDGCWSCSGKTEEWAFRRIVESVKNESLDPLYVAFPWAALMDEIDSGATDSSVHVDRFRRFCELLPKGVEKATVCQHPLARKFTYLFRMAGIGHIFWSHATHIDVQTAAVGGAPFFYPFPLYPAKVSDGLPEAMTDADINDMDARLSKRIDESLGEGVFTLCPFGGGPNSIRLWESIAAGSIPIVLADTWALPGNPRLWELGAVFCKDDPQGIEALPERLAKIAEDPERMNSMRLALRQLWLLYGPQGFVTDVQELILFHGKGGGSRFTGSASGSAVDRLIEAALDAGDEAALLLHLATGLLLDRAGGLRRIETDRRLQTALERARQAQPDGSAPARQFDAVLGRATHPSGRSPGVVLDVVPKVCLFGRRSNRTPLSYEPLRRIVGSRLEIVDAPEKADLIVSGINLDFREGFEALLPALKKPRRPKLVVISEEPVWDITWSGPFLGRNGRIAVGDVELEYTFLGHETSDIFHFERIPYFLLTSNSYPVRYANMIGRFAGVSPKEMCERWRKAQISAAFFMEKRSNKVFSMDFPDRDVTGLSAYRTSVAQLTKIPGVLRCGKGWVDDAPRQDLPDWHLDKLARLDGRTRVLAAFENVHQRNYISEKIFDAFAVGAVPMYWASPQHRVFELLSERSFLNTHKLDAPAAAESVMEFVPTEALAEAWLETAGRFSALFADIGAIHAERRRVVEAVLRNVAEIS